MSANGAPTPSLACAALARARIERTVRFVGDMVKRPPGSNGRFLPTRGGPAEKRKSKDKTVINRERPSFVKYDIVEQNVFETKPTGLQVTKRDK